MDLDSGHYMSMNAHTHNMHIYTHMHILCVCICLSLCAHIIVLTKEEKKGKKRVGWKEEEAGMMLTVHL